MLASLSATALVLAACGGSPLERAGQGSTEWIGEGAPTTLPPIVLETTTTTVAPRETVGLQPAVGLDWLNDRLTPYTAETPDEVVDLVWSNSAGADSYVQAHRTAISRALPGVKFPAAIPDDVLHITSQLVFTTASGDLGSPWIAAFGFWTTAPYTEPRSVSQSVVLHVGRSSGTTAGCDTLALGAGDRCGDVMVAGLGQAAQIIDTDGVTLAWDDGPYRYELFYRTTDAPEVAAFIAGSMIELTDLETRAVLAYRGVTSRISAASPPSE